jgi:hypothetical protein
VGALPMLCSTVRVQQPHQWKILFSASHVLILFYYCFCWWWSTGKRTRSFPGVDVLVVGGIQFFCEQRSNRRAVTLHRHGFPDLSGVTRGMKGSNNVLPRKGLHKGWRRCDYTTPLGLKLLCHNENQGLPSSWQPLAVEQNRYAVLKAHIEAKTLTARSCWKGRGKSARALCPPCLMLLFVGGLVFAEREFA